VALDSLLIEILVDPEDKEPLWYLEDDQVLYNPRLRRRYAIRDGIPIMLIAEAESVDEAEHAALEQKAHVLTGNGPAIGHSGTSSS
jgi:uncharacterized protein